MKSALLFFFVYAPFFLFSQVDANLLKTKLPYFKTKDFDEINPKSRFFVIRGGADNILLKRNDNGELVKACSFGQNSTVAFYSEGLDMSQFDTFDISINGRDNLFDGGLLDLFNLFEEKRISENSDYSKDLLSASGDTNQLDTVKILNKIYSELWFMKEALNKHDIDIFTQSDYERLNNFQNLLKDELNILNYKYKFNNLLRDLIYEVLNYKPKYTPLSLVAERIPDNDEIEIIVNYSLIEGVSNLMNKEIVTQKYHTSGIVGIAANSNLFITGLKNNKIYLDSTDYIAGGDSLVRPYKAFLESDVGVNVGIGMNLEIYMTTGTIFTPSLNIGFFVPFGENFGPYLAFGPGISIGNTRAKLSLSAGVTLGQINSIAERYKDKNFVGRDMTGVDLSSKIWKPSYHIGIGVSYDLIKIKTKEQ